jgi:hypothetical protein
LYGEVIKHMGSIHYDLPHMKKKALERQGKLPAGEGEKGVSGAAIACFNCQ